MDVATTMLIISAWVFGLWALQALLAELGTPRPQLIVFVYCLIAVICLLYFGGVLGHGRL